MKQSTKRLVSSASAFALVIVAMTVYFNMIQPAYQEDQAVKAEMISRQNFVNGQKAAIGQVKSLINSYKGEGQIQQVVSMVLPLSPDLSGAFAQLGGLIQNNRLALQSMTVGPPVMQPGRRKPNGQGFASPSLTKPFGSITFQMRMVGSYEDFKSFLKNLETNIRVFDVQRIGVQPTSNSSQDVFTYDLSVSTYYQGP